MTLHASDHVGEVAERIDAARFARRDERVEASDVRARVDVADEEEVLPAERHASKRRLGRGVVERDAHVLEEAAEVVQSTNAVLDRLADWTLRQVTRTLLIEPRAEAIAHRPGSLSAKFQV